MLSILPSYYLVFLALGLASVVVVLFTAFNESSKHEMKRRQNRWKNHDYRHAADQTVAFSFGSTRQVISDEWSGHHCCFVIRHSWPLPNQKYLSNMSKFSRADVSTDYKWTFWYRTSHWIKGRSCRTWHWLMASRFFHVQHEFRAGKAQQWWETAQAAMAPGGGWDDAVIRNMEAGFYNHCFCPVGPEGPAFCIWEVREGITAEQFQDFIDGPNGVNFGLGAWMNICREINVELAGNPPYPRKFWRRLTSWIGSLQIDSAVPPSLLPASAGEMREGLTKTKQPCHQLHSATTAGSQRAGDEFHIHWYHQNN